MIVATTTHAMWGALGAASLLVRFSDGIQDRSPRPNLEAEGSEGSEGLKVGERARGEAERESRGVASENGIQSPAALDGSASDACWKLDNTLYLPVMCTQLPV